MARGLSALFGPRQRPARRIALLALVLGVLAVHGCVTSVVAQRMGEVKAEAAGPPRMEVAYVREMKLSAPPPTAAPAAPVVATDAPAPVRRRKAKPPKPASAPEPEPERPDPEPVAEAASAPVAVAASAPIAASAPVAVAAAAPASSPASAPAVFEWPVSTRVSYWLTGNYHGEVKGSAQVEWVRVGSHYQVHVDFLVGPSFAPIITQRSTSDGEITAAGLAPRRYDQDVRVLGSDRPRQTVLFDAGNVILANGDVHPVAAGMQDTASQFVQLTYLFSTRPSLLRVGGSVDIPLALPKKVDTWTYDVVGEETLYTPFGALQGIHLKPRNPRSPGSISVEMWFAPQLQYFPARLRFEQDGGNYVDLMIAKPPEMAR